MQAKALFAYDFRKVDMLLFGFVEGYRVKDGKLNEAISEFMRIFCIEEDELSFSALKIRYHNLAKKANKTIRQNLDIEDDALEMRRVHNSLISELKRIIYVNSGHAASDDRV